MEIRYSGGFNMNHWQNGGGTPPSADHIYVNGYGFISEDPWQRENRDIWKNSAIVGILLICVLAVPALCSYPVQLLLSFFLAPFAYFANDTYAAAQLQALYLQLRELLLYAASMLFPLLLAAALLRPKRRRSPSFFRRPSPHVLSCGVGIAMAAWILFYLGGDLLADGLLQLGVLSMSPDTGIPAAPAAVFVYLIRMLLPALLEELLFRGYILRSMRQFGDSFAIIASSVAFGLVHYTWVQDLRAFALGMVLAYFVIRGGSLWTAVTARLSCIVLGLALDCLPRLFPGEMSPFFAHFLMLAVLAAGLLCFVQFCRTEGNPFVLSSGHTATRISRKLARFFGNAFLILAIILWGIQAAGYLQVIG